MAVTSQAVVNQSDLSHFEWLIGNAVHMIIIIIIMIIIIIILLIII